MGLATRGEFGKPWDFDGEVTRGKARKIAKSKTALLQIVGPMRAAFSNPQTFNIKKTVEQMMK